MRAPLAFLAVLVAAAALAGAALARPAPPEARGGGWHSAGANLQSTRSVSRTSISAATAPGLRVRWRFRFDGGGAGFGAVTATPVVVGDTVYIQDAKSSVFALDLETGALRWERLYAARNDGPNGVGVGYGRVYANTDTTAFALDARTGKRMWSRRLASKTEQFVDIAPVVANGLVYTSTVGFPPGGRGAIYALDARTGRVRWKFDTIRDPWPKPEAGGGGAWYPMSVDGRGRVYAGIANPGPWGGAPGQPNGGWYRGHSLYTSSLVVLDGRTGKLLWHDQVVKDDIRDYDFQNSPVLARLRVAGRTRPVVFGSGKGGRVIAWDRATRERIWSTSVGTHLNDLGLLPRERTRVCPGLFGGPLTPMALAGGRLFVPVVELCMTESAVHSYSVLQRPPWDGNGVLYALEAATGRKLWSTVLGQPLFGCATAARDVVFAPTYDGRVFGLAARDGRVLWSAAARAGINACPAVAGDLLLVPAGAPHRDHARPVAELIAYGP